MTSVAEPTDSAGEVRSWRATLVAGIAGGLLAAALVVILIALPLFFLAAVTDKDDGLDRPIVRDGLRAAPFIAVAVVVPAGVLIGRWWRRGGQIPEPD